MAALVMKYVVVINSTVDLLSYNSYFIWKDKYLYDCVLVMLYTLVRLVLVADTNICHFDRCPTAIPMSWTTPLLNEQGISFICGGIKLINASWIRTY